MDFIDGYEVDLSKGVTKGAGGTVGKAKKDGKIFFYKQFKKPTFPDPKDTTFSPKALEKKLRNAEEFKTKKEKINTALSENSSRGGNIIFPICWKVYKNHWFEFTEYVNNAIDDKDYNAVISKLSEENKLRVFINTLGALKTIHNQKIVHGDLKLTNIMLVENNTAGEVYYDSKVIDFDGAFFEGQPPEDDICGTPDYYSPEQGIYNLEEDPHKRKELAKNITTKSDIFTMGLVLHEYLTGKKPTSDKLSPLLKKRSDEGKFIYPWEIVVNHEGTENPLIVSKEIKNPLYKNLISKMLNPKHSERPTASELLLMIGKRNVFCEPQPGDNIIWNKAKLKEYKYVEIKASEKDGCYILVNENGKEQEMPVKTLKTMNFAIPKVKSSKEKEERISGGITDKDSKIYILNMDIPADIKFYGAFKINGKECYKVNYKGQIKYFSAQTCETMGIFKKNK